MRKKYIIGIILVSIFLLSGCENVDLSKVSDKDLERISEKAIACNKPYIRFGTSCCLDKNGNNVCDRDEKTIEVIEESTKGTIPEKFLPEKCLIETSFTCISSKVKPTQSTIIFQNGYGKSVTIDRVNIGRCSKTFSTTLISEEEGLFVVTGCSNGEVKEVFKGDVAIKYTEGDTGLTKTAYGKIETKIENGGLVPDKFLPNRCTLPSGIGCVDHKATPDNVIVVLRNGLGYDMTWVTVELENCGSVGTPSTILNGDIQTYTINCYPQLSGEIYSGKLNVYYSTPETGLSHKSIGALESDIETTGHSCSDECSGDRCSALEYFKCVKKSDGCRYLEDKSKVIGKCGVECKTDSDCGDNEKCSSYKCIGVEYCGNGVCDTGETCVSCEPDCGCPENYVCSGGNCYGPVICGDGKCNWDENCMNCAIDCYCGQGETCIGGACCTDEYCSV